LGKDISFLFKKQIFLEIRRGLLTLDYVVVFYFIAPQGDFLRCIRHRRAPVGGVGKGVLFEEIKRLILF
jgi:hypothetical protein